MKKLILILFLASVCSLGSAWGPLAQQHICESAAYEIFGSQAASCFADPAGVCDVLAFEGQESYERCLALGGVHPSLASSLVFEDPENHYNYSACPFSSKYMSDWVCVKGGLDYASEAADKWMARAGESEELCGRVYSFCIASSYLSDARTPLYQVLYVEPDSKKAFEDRVDSKLGDEGWSFSSMIVFQQKQKRSTERVDVSEKDLEGIVEFLASEYAYLTPSVQVETDTCGNNILDPGEAGVDCGGPCPPCTTSTLPSCFDGARNQGETGIDCGGPCPPCSSEAASTPFWGVLLGLASAFFLFMLLVFAILVFLFFMKKRRKDMVVDDDVGRDLKRIEENLDEVRSSLDDI